MKKNFFIFLCILILLFTSCRANVPDGQALDASMEEPTMKQLSDHPLSAKGLCRMRYTETTPEGTCEIFADETYDRVRLVITNTDGTKEQHYVDGLSMFTELADEIDRQQMLDWKYLETADVEKPANTEIKVECVIVSRTDTFGSARMPVGGIAMLQKLKEIALSYVTDENEMKPFTVEIAGKTYSTVRGTGNSVGTGAVIDFGDDKWWEVEGFVGEYALTDPGRKVSEELLGENNDDLKNVTLSLRPDGAVTFTVDDKVYEGTCDAERKYQCYASAMNGWLMLDLKAESGTAEGQFIEVRVDPEPYPVNSRGCHLLLERQ